MNHIQQRFALGRAVVFFGAILLITTVSCKKDRLLGLEVQPDGQFDPLEYVDSLRIKAFTIEGEPQRSDEAQIFIGKLNTPAFGISSSALSLNFTFVTGNTQLDFEGFQVDSVRLYLRPSTVYGESSISLPIEVLELDEYIRDDSAYYSDYAPAMKPEVMATTAWSLDDVNALTDSMRIDSVLEPFMLDIELPNELGNTLLELLSNPDAQDFNGFQEQFNGLHIRVPESEVPTEPGAIYSFGLLTGHSGIRVYLSSPDTNYRPVLRYPISSQCARFLKFSHDYTGSMAQPYLDDSTKNDLIFVQGLAGMKSEIHIPELYEMGRERLLAVSKAVLEFKMSDQQPEAFGRSKKLYLLDLEADGEETLTLDYIYDQERAGGKYDDELNGYRFDITRYVQKVFSEARQDKDVNYGLRLHAQVPVLNGNDTSHNVIQGVDNIVLKLYQTDLND